MLDIAFDLGSINGKTGQNFKIKCKTYVEYHRGLRTAHPNLVTQMGVLVLKCSNNHPYTNHQYTEDRTGLNYAGIF